MFSLERARLLVTGGSGFIGSNFINHVLHAYPHALVVNLDRLDYSSVHDPIDVAAFHDRYAFVRGDIAERHLVAHVLRQYQLDVVVHFAAQTHVDRSYSNSTQFTVDNVLGTHCLLEEVRAYGRVRRFLHFSTDEVYGEHLDGEALSSEDALLNPTNPYAASKAAAEFFVSSYRHSYHMPVLITRCNNVYGEKQYPDKLIPRFICALQRGEPCPIQGTGECERVFVHVMDVARAVCVVLQRGALGEVYNIGSTTNAPLSVNAIHAMLVRRILGEHVDPATMRRPVRDRPFNDRRYHIDSSSLRALGWREQEVFDGAIEQLIAWYAAHRTEDTFVGE